MILQQVASGDAGKFTASLEISARRSMCAYFCTHLLDVTTMNVEVFQPGDEHRPAFLAAVRRSKSVFDRWVAPPDTPERYADYLRRYSVDTHYSYLAKTGDGTLVGCINLNEIVRGSLQSAYLGYYAFHPNQGKGLMKKAMSAVLSLAFGTHELHRLEANIQPGNMQSVGLVKSLGFRLEGYSPRYLKIDGEWRDHERYAITSEEWPSGTGQRR